MHRLLCLLFFIPITSCHEINSKESREQNVSDSSDSGLKKIDELNYTVEYSKKWDLDRSGAGGAQFALFSKLESNNDSFRDNINLIIQDLNGQQMDLDSYSKLSEEQVRLLVPHAVVIENRRISGPADDFQRVIYTGDQGSYHLKYEQYYIIKKEKAYILTFAAESHVFDTYKDDAEHVLNSFRLK